MSRVFATLALVLFAAGCGPEALSPEPEALDRASPDLIQRLQADPFNYFRFVNRPWIRRACHAFAGDLPDLPVVRLHGDAHVEQFAFTQDAWGLDDFDDSARGPALIDIVRFLGSIDLATRQRSWHREHDALFDRFFEGYRRGLAEIEYRPPVPDIVREMRAERPLTRPEFLAWGDAQMQPMSEASLKVAVAGMRAFAGAVHRERPEFAPDYFDVLRAGWLHIGIGSAANQKILIRVQGPTADPADDELLEAKEVTLLDGLDCLEAPSSGSALRVIAGTKQIGRLKHNILAAGPELVVPGSAPGRRLSAWWIRSWDPSYREVRLIDLRSAKDLGDIAYDSGLQLGAGSLQDQKINRDAVQKQALASTAALEKRLRKEAETLVEALLRGWQEFRQTDHATRR